MGLLVEQSLDGLAIARIDQTPQAMPQPVRTPAPGQIDVAVGFVVLVVVVQAAVPHLVMAVRTDAYVDVTRCACDRTRPC